MIEGRGDRLTENDRCWIRAIGSPDWHTPGPTSSIEGPKLQRLITDSPSLPFFKEEQLQLLITDSPSVLPGVGAQPTSVAIQLHVPHAGLADMLVVDGQGEITIIECKLAANPEIRHWVVGQVLSYAAGLWKLTYEEFEHEFKAAGTALTEPFETVPGWSRDAFRSAVTQNLAAGAFRLIIAVDEITDELNRTVAFLSSRRTPHEIRLLALDLRRAADDGVEILLLEEGAEGRVRAKRRPYDRERLIAGIRARSLQAALAAEDLLHWGKSEGLVIRYTASEGVVLAPGGGTLFRIVGYREMVRVSLRTLRSRGKSEADERLEHLLVDLDKLGMRLTGNHAKAPIESLAEDESTRTEFKVLMKRALEILAG